VVAASETADGSLGSGIPCHHQFCQGNDATHNGQGILAAFATLFTFIRLGMLPRWRRIQPVNQGQMPGENGISHDVCDIFMVLCHGYVLVPILWVAGLEVVTNHLSSFPFTDELSIRNASSN
jgi:hypothetical protein